jgi:hypothetical protein
MRVLRLFIALLAVPFALSFAQGKSHSPEHCASLRAKLSSTRAAPQALISALKKCQAETPPADDPPPPPPPTNDDPPQSWGGTATIDGTLFQDADPWPGLSGWTVTLSGTVNTSVTSDEWGRYHFGTLPTGEYTVCVTAPLGWVQTWPESGAACPGGPGYAFPLQDGTGAFMNNFGFVHQ